MRISRDLHDNIGAQLTFIISSIDNLKFGLQNADIKVVSKLKNISEFTSHTIYELRDTIWAMNKTHISVEDLQARISNFIEKANASTENVAFHFEVSEKIKPFTKFSSVEGMNIYRIIQESVNNALKHSEAKNITVSFEKAEFTTEDSEENTGKYIVKIADDGTGFSAEKNEMGNGMMSMKKRTKELGGTIKIKSVVGKRTSVTVVF